jgi:hypothetical protein
MIQPLVQLDFKKKEFVLVLIHSSEGAVSRDMKILRRFGKTYRLVA